MSLQDAASPETKRMQADPGRRSQKGPVMDVSEGERLDFCFVFFFLQTRRQPQTAAGRICLPSGLASVISDVNKRSCGFCEKRPGLGGGVERAQTHWTQDKSCSLQLCNCRHKIRFWILTCTRLASAHCFPSQSANQLSQMNLQKPPLIPQIYRTPKTLSRNESQLPPAPTLKVLLSVCEQLVF